MYRRTGWPKLLPVNLTLSVTNNCDFRCKTCYKWKVASSKKEFSSDEWKKVFKSLDKSVMWLTFSGGNQFLRKDFYKIVNHAVSITKPCLINIPVSNQNTKDTIKQLTIILKHSKTPLMINLSLDGDKSIHDSLRGRKNSFCTTIDTFKKLKKLKKTHKQLSVCFHTIVSEYNIDALDKIRELVSKLQPDYWAFEPLQRRAEFYNTKKCISLDYRRVFSKIEKLRLNKDASGGMIGIKDVTKQVYYYFAEKTLQENKSVLPCYTSIASVQISPEGDVFECSTNCTILGNLRESGYDFKKIFFGQKADSVRKKIKDEKCFCIQCNSFYTNLMCNPKFFLEYLIKHKKLKC